MVQQNAYFNNGPHTNNMVNEVVFPVEHHKLRYEIAALFNAFLDFERRHNRK